MQRGHVHIYIHICIRTYSDVEDGVGEMLPRSASSMKLVSHWQMKNVCSYVCTPDSSVEVGILRNEVCTSNYVAIFSKKSMGCE